MFKAQKTAKADAPDQPDPLAPSAEYLAAVAHYREISERHAELFNAESGMRLARSMAASGDNKRVPEKLRATAHPYIKLARKRPEKISENLLDVQDELAEFLPIFFAETEAIAAAKRRETNRLAGLLQPRHRAAVREMASALEQLSRATEAEREVRAELARRAPLPTSPNLPDLSGELLLGCMFEHDGRLWSWARHIRKLGILQ